MIPARALVLLDTSALVFLLRGGHVGKRIDRVHGLRTRRDRPLISIVSVGELAALARKRGWGPAKRTAMTDLVAELVVIELGQGDIVEASAEIDHFSEREHKPARPMGKNDIWIAATAKASGAHLLTSDSDFDHLGPMDLQVHRFSATTGDPVP